MSVHGVHQMPLSYGGISMESNPETMAEMPVIQNCWSGRDGLGRKGISLQLKDIPFHGEREPRAQVLTSLCR